MVVKCSKCGSTNTYFAERIIFIFMACYKCRDCGNEFAIPGWQGP